jgi:hypothetical protein
LFWSFCYLLFRCVLQLVSLRPRSEDFKELEIVVAPARAVGAAPTDSSTATDEDRSPVPCRGKSAVAAVEVEIVPRHANDAAPVASAAHRQALDLWRSQRAAADRRRNQCAGAPAGA